MTPDEQVDRPRRATLLIDSALAAAFFAITLFADGVLFATTNVDPVVSFFLCAPLALRRTHPVPSVVAVYVAGLFQLLQGYHSISAASFAIIGSLYSVTAFGPRWASRTALGAGMVGAVLLGFSLTADGGLRVAVIVLLIMFPVLLATWAAGMLRGTRHDARAAREERLTRLAVEREQELRLAAQAERARIAREMHDIVAHSLTVMIAQADGGRYAGATEPAAATHALETIAETGRAALADMRRLLGVLREDDDESAGSPGTLAPQPASGDLEALVEQVRASGLRVSLVRMGTPRTLPPGVGLTAYRICQEALTNVMKHAGPDPTVTMLVQWSPTGLGLEVSDDGRGAAAASEDAGHGLLGMRERAMMLGGTLTAGPRPGGGYRVRAQLPLPAPGGTP